MPDPYSLPVPAAPLAFRSGPEGQLIAVGEVDVATSPLLLEALTAAIESAEGPTVEVDFAGVSFLDSTGLNVLVEGRSRALAADKQIVLTNSSKRVLRVLRITGLDAVFMPGLNDSPTSLAGDSPAK